VSVRSHDGQGGFAIGFASILQGVGLAFAAVLAASAVIGLAVAWTPAWDAADSLLVSLNVAAMACGGWLAGRRAPRLGWLHGGLAGLLYMLLVSWLLAPVAGVDQALAVVGWKPLLYGFLAGAAGGIVGVLFKK